LEKADPRELQTHPKEEGSMAGLLSITFRGPFVFVFSKDAARNVDVYAPACDGHAAGIFYSSASLPISRMAQQGHNHIYRISGTGLSSFGGAITKLGANLGTLPAAPSAGLPLSAFHVVVPRPKIVYGLIPDDVEIVTGSPTGTFQSYATSLRFYYDWTTGSAVTLQSPAYPHPQPPNPPPPLNIAPPAGAPLPDYGDISIEYGSPESGDVDHNDAISCFAKIAQVAGVSWWLNYYNSSGGGPAFRAGSDCTAVPLVFGV
jgi:hypothetical protein